MAGQGSARAGSFTGHAGTRPSSAADLIDLHAARQAGRSCCCPAKPMVVAVMPPAPGRPHPTELLLCGHHYRVCRQTLAAAGAAVTDLDGVPVTGCAWTVHGSI